MMHNDTISGGHKPMNLEVQGSGGCAFGYSMAGLRVLELGGYADEFFPNPRTL